MDTHKTIKRKKKTGNESVQIKALSTLVLITHNSNHR